MIWSTCFCYYNGNIELLGLFKSSLKTFCLNRIRHFSFNVIFLLNLCTHRIEISTFEYAEKSNICVRVVVCSYEINRFWGCRVAVRVVNWPKSYLPATFRKNILPDTVLHMVKEISGWGRHKLSPVRIRIELIYVEDYSDLSGRGCKLNRILSSDVSFHQNFCYCELHRETIAFGMWKGLLNLL